VRDRERGERGLEERVVGGRKEQKRRKSREGEIWIRKGFLVVDFPGTE
jgi:hypothetical protein